jgi:hypothetical protein
MSLLKGTVVENSLENNDILKEVQIDRTRQDGSWTLHDVMLSENQALTFGRYLADGPWYVHFWEPGEDSVIVVFKDRAFRLLHSDVSTWVDAVAYGKSIGIPEEQLDFLIS